MTNPEHLAFPAFNEKGECQSDATGLTKLEYFSAMVMQASIIHHGEQWSAHSCVEAAVALIEVLNKE